PRGTQREYTPPERLLELLRGRLLHQCFVRHSRLSDLMLVDHLVVVPAVTTDDELPGTLRELNEDPGTNFGKVVFVGLRPNEREQIGALGRIFGRLDHLHRIEGKGTELHP